MRMALVLVALTLATALPQRPATAKSPADEATAPIVAMIREAVRAEDTGDPEAGRFYAPIQSITDSVPPFHWHGADARDRWMDAIARDFETRNRGNGAIVLADPTVAKIEGSFAYFVFPAAFTFTENNMQVTREATIAITATLTGGEWKIASWTWAGPN
ncbi:MAG: hypothetical protein ACK4TG_02700 [Thermaurantiacus sp.]